MPKGKPAAKPEKRAPTESEAAAIEAAKAAHGARPVRARMNFSENETGTVDVASPHSDGIGAAYMLHDAFATESDAFLNTALAELSNAAKANGTLNGVAVNASLALIGAIAPRDELEAALALQMSATHDLSLEMLRRTRNAGHVEGCANTAIWPPS